MHDHGCPAGLDPSCSKYLTVCRSKAAVGEMSFLLVCTRSSERRCMPCSAGLLRTIALMQYSRRIRDWPKTIHMTVQDNSTLPTYLEECLSMNRGWKARWGPHGCQAHCKAATGSHPNFLHKGLTAPQLIGTAASASDSSVDCRSQE